MNSGLLKWFTVIPVDITLKWNYGGEYVVY